MLAPEPIIKGEAGFNPANSQRNESLCYKFMQNGRTMSPRPKAHLRQMNLQWGQKQRGMAKSGYDHHITEFGGNLKVNKSSFVEVADLF